MKLLSQRSKDYSGLKINGTASSVYNYGCLVVVLAMASGSTVRQVLSRIGFTNDYVNWTGLDKIGLEKYGSQNKYSSALDNIKAVEAIKQHGFVIARVDWDGNQLTKKDTHFVLMVGNGKIYDPIDGKEKPSSTYRIYTGLRFIKKIGVKPEEQNMSDIYLGQDLNNKEAMKVAVRLWDEVMIKGKYNDYKSPEAFKEAVELLKSGHKKQVADLKLLHKKDLENSQLKMEKVNKVQVDKLLKTVETRDLRISDLKIELLRAGQTTKARYTSRKFVLPTVGMIVPTIAAIAVLLGKQIDVQALTAALSGIFGMVAMFVGPEFYNDYKQRAELTK